MKTIIILTGIVFVFSSVAINAQSVESSKDTLSTEKLLETKLNQLKKLEEELNKNKEAQFRLIQDLEQLRKQPSKQTIIERRKKLLDELEELKKLELGAIQSTNESRAEISRMDTIKREEKKEGYVKKGFSLFGRNKDIVYKYDKITIAGIGPTLLPGFGSSITLAKSPTSNGFSIMRGWAFNSFMARGSFIMGLGLCGANIRLGERFFIMANPYLGYHTYQENERLSFTKKSTVDGGLSVNTCFLFSKRVGANFAGVFLFGTGKVYACINLVYKLNKPKQ